MRIVSSFVLAFFLFGSVVPVVQAGDVSTEDVFKDSFYGGLVGALIGGALLVFKDNRSEHYDMIGYGAAIGVIGGAVYGLTRAGKSLAQVEKGKVVFQFPVFYLKTSSSVPGKTDSILESNLITFNF